MIIVTLFFIYKHPCRFPAVIPSRQSNSRVNNMSLRNVTILCCIFLHLAQNLLNYNTTYFDFFADPVVYYDLFITDPVTHSDPVLYYDVKSIYI